MMDSYIAVDLETTGLHPWEDEILEIGAVRVKEGRLAETFSVLVDTKKKIPEFVTKLTGITREMTGSGLSLENAVREWIDFCGDCAILGHNVLFDYRFLKKAAQDLGLSFERQGVDTLEIARKHLKFLGNRSLEALCTYYGIPQEVKHRACEDAAAASRLYQCMLEEYGSTCPADFVSKPLHYRVKKASPATRTQKVYLIDLAKYHKIDLDVSIEHLTRSQASRLVDHIIRQYGRMKR